MVQVEAEEIFEHQTRSNVDFQYLIFLKIIVSNVTADDRKLITEFELVFYVEIMTRSELWLAVV